MQSTYRLHTDELDSQFLEAIKLLFANKIIEIKISDVAVEKNGYTHVDEMDETDYLLSSPANRKHLLEAIEHVNRGENLIEVNLDELEKALDQAEAAA
jgi:antitoxin YefM